MLSTTALLCCPFDQVVVETGHAAYLLVCFFFFLFFFLLFSFSSVPYESLSIQSDMSDLRKMQGDSFKKRKQQNEPAATTSLSLSQEASRPLKVALESGTITLNGTLVERKKKGEKDRVCFVCVCVCT